MATASTDFDELTRDSSRSPEFCLWLTVTLRAFEDLRNGWAQKSAQEWIEDPENGFFEAVADEMGYEPDGFRERIREALARAGEPECHRLALAYGLGSPRARG